MMLSASASATSPSSLFDELVLNHLRRAHVRARLALNHIDAAGTALRGGLIDGEDALGIVAEAGLLDFVITEVSS